MTTSAMRALPVGVDAQLRPVLVPVDGRCRPPAAEDPEVLAPARPAVVILATPSALFGRAGVLIDRWSETWASGRDKNWVENEEVGRKPAGLLGQVKVDHRELRGTWPLLVYRAPRVISLRSPALRRATAEPPLSARLRHRPPDRGGGGGSKRDLPRPACAAGSSRTGQARRGEPSNGSRHARTSWRGHV